MRLAILLLLFTPSLAFAQTGSGGAGVPFGSTAAAYRGWKVPPEEAARLTREGWTRHIEPETGNEQWSKSSYSDAASFQVSTGDAKHGSCPPQVLKVGGS